MGTDQSTQPPVAMEPLIAALDAVGDAILVVDAKSPLPEIVYENASSRRNRQATQASTHVDLATCDYTISEVHDENDNLIGVVASRPNLPNDQFVKDALSMISHELRTPLTSLLGAIELLHSGDAGKLSADAKKFISVARQNCELLSDLFPDFFASNLLDSARNSENAEQSTRITNVIGQVVHLVRPVAVLRNISLRIIPTLVPSVVADIPALNQVLYGYMLALVQELPPATIIQVSFEERDGFVFCYLQDNKGEVHSASSIDFDDFALVETSGPPYGGAGDSLLKLRTVVENNRGSMGRFNIPGISKTVWFSLPVFKPSLKKR